MVLSSGPIIRNPRRVPDNVLLTFGVDGDGIIVLNTAGLSANEEVDDVIEGTSAHLGNAANSLIISNTTTDSDIHILVSKGGNSHTAFLADGSTGDTILNAATGQSVDLYVAGTKEYDFSASSLGMNSNTISSSGNISGSNGNSFQLLNEVASSTNPTLVPNQTEADTGIGWASDVIHIVLGGGDEYSFSASSANFNSNTLSNVGASGNDWSATSLSVDGANSGATSQFFVRNTTSDDTGSDARFTAEVSGSGSGDPYSSWIVGGGGHFKVGIDNSGGDADDLFVINRGGTFDTDDAIHIANTSPPDITYNTTHPTGTFDYICDHCGRHEASVFSCCGPVAWHDDVMDFRAMVLREPTGIAYMEKIGVIERGVDSLGRETEFTRLGADFHFAMSAAFQNRVRMDRLYFEHQTHFSTVDDRLEGVQQAINILREQVEALGATPEA